MSNLEIVRCDAGYALDVPIVTAKNVGGVGDEERQTMDKQIVDSSQV